MLLKQYLKRKKISVRDFAKITNMGHPTLYGIINGTRTNVTLKNAVSIEMATEGEITCLQLYNSLLKENKKRSKSTQKAGDTKANHKND